MSEVSRLVTGGLVDRITHGLIVAADDSNPTTKLAIKETLLEMGQRKPPLTITTILWTIANRV